MRDPVVDQGAHPLQEFDARILEWPRVASDRGARSAAHGAEEAARLAAFAFSRLFFHSTLLHFHGQNFYFQLARLGKGRPSRSAIRCAGAACDLHTSSSPFLNSPTRLSRRMAVVAAPRSGHPAWRRCKALRCGDGRGIFPLRRVRAPFFQALAPSTSCVNSGMRFTGTGAKYASISSECGPATRATPQNTRRSLRAQHPVHQMPSTPGRGA